MHREQDTLTKGSCQKEFLELRKCFEKVRICDINVVGINVCVQVRKKK
jgi:hypothetical protein